MKKLLLCRPPDAYKGDTLGWRGGCRFAFAVTLPIFLLLVCLGVFAASEISSRIVCFATAAIFGIPLLVYFGAQSFGKEEPDEVSES